MLGTVSPKGFAMWQGHFGEAVFCTAQAMLAYDMARAALRPSVLNIFFLVQLRLVRLTCCAMAVLFSRIVCVCVFV